MGDLKPCPFCGGEPTVKPRVGKFAAEVYCDADFCGVNPTSSSLDIAYAKARWDTRSDEAAKEIERLRALLAEAREYISPCFSRGVELLDKINEVLTQGSGSNG